MRKSRGKRIGPPAHGEVSKTATAGDPTCVGRGIPRTGSRFTNLKLTNDYFGRYEAISRILDLTPRLLGLVHRDMRKALESENKRRRKGSFRVTSEMVLRLTLCQMIERTSLRGIVVRVDDSQYLRRFTRIHEGPMVNYTTLCKRRNTRESREVVRIPAGLLAA